jgi:hypothetical protein
MSTDEEKKRDEEQKEGDEDDRRDYHRHFGRKAVIYSRNMKKPHGKEATNDNKDQSNFAEKMKKEESEVVTEAVVKKVKKESTTMTMYYLALVNDWQGVSYHFSFYSLPLCYSSLLSPPARKSDGREW